MESGNWPERASCGPGARVPERRQSTVGPSIHRAGSPPRTSLRAVRASVARAACIRFIHAKQGSMNSRRKLTWGIADHSRCALDCALLRAGNVQDPATARVTVCVPDVAWTEKAAHVVKGDTKSP